MKPADLVVEALNRIRRTDRFRPRTDNMAAVYCSEAITDVLIARQVPGDWRDDSTPIELDRACATSQAMTARPLYELLGEIVGDLTRKAEALVPVSELL